MPRRLRLAFACLAFAATSSHPFGPGWHPLGVAEQRLPSPCEPRFSCLVAFPTWNTWPAAMVLPAAGALASLVALGCSLARRRVPGLHDGLCVAAGASTGVGVCALGMLAHHPPWAPGLQLGWVAMHFAPAWAMQLKPARAAWLGTAAVGAGVLFFEVWRGTRAC